MRLLLDECIDERLSLRDLAPLVQAVVSALGSIGPGDVMRVG